MLTSECYREHDISAELTPPAVPGYDEPCARRPREIAVRAAILRWVVAVSAGIDPAPILEWFHNQHV
ncbi:MAG: hypothetical protein HN849_27100 [Victivallales bacterium]|nr:hypothetical protein [Victivallales bacterium]MBT7303226.1 hypothetical protein [Victivallales bacterium]